MDARHAPRGREAPTLSLILPTFNPGVLLERTWEEVERFLRLRKENWEALFVCDGCNDGTSERLLEWVRTTPAAIRVVSYRPNRGKGYAVRRGLEAARGEWRLFTDVDLAYSFDDIILLADTLRTGSDVAIASRTHPESRMILPVGLQGYAYRRHLQSLAFSYMVRCFLPVLQRDTQAGLKGMSAAVARAILPHLTCNGFAFDCELLTACSHFGFRVTEVPVTMRYEDMASTTNVSAMTRMLREIARIRRVWRAKPPVELVSSEPGHRRAA